MVAATLNGVTAWQMFHRLAKVDAEEWILVHGAAGGVGSLLLELARLKNVRAIGTSSAKKASVVTSREALHIDYEDQSLIERVRRISNGGVVAAFDHIGGGHVKRVSLLRFAPAVCAPYMASTT